jgi:hypothetical protein
MADNNLSGLAGECLVAGELSRRGYLVAITMGHAKAIDLFVKTQKGTIKIDVKASQYNTSWPIKDADEDLVYVFVYLHKREKITDNDIKGIDTPPEYYIVPGREVKKLIMPWKSIPGIKYTALQEYKEKWNLLPKP